MAEMNWKSLCGKYQQMRAAVLGGRIGEALACINEAENLSLMSGNSGPAQTRTRATATPDTGTAKRGRPAAAKQTATKNGTPLADRVYQAIAGRTNGIAQGKLKISGYQPNIIGMSLARLKKSGRVIERDGLLYATHATETPLSMTG